MDENTDSNYVRDSTVIDDTIYGLINEAFEMERKTNNPEYRNSIFKENREYFVKTDDGSYSIKSREINHKVETLHTSTGAISESFEKFIKPLKLNYEEDIAILDICAGLGYNTSAAVDDFLKNYRGNASLQVDMLEISKPTLAAGLLVPSPIEAHDITKVAIEEELLKEGYASLKMENSKIPDNVDLDPFSQNMAPELVSLDFFNEFRRVIKENGIVATYTSSAPVRMAFIEADFYVSQGPIFGRFQGGTLASPTTINLTKSLPRNDEIRMALSDVGVPFRDPDLDLSSKEILDNRTEERHRARHNTKISSAVKTPIFLGQEMEDEPLKRRVERNLARMNIPGVLSDEAFYLIEPEEDWCEDYREDNNSRTRILEMMSRLDEIAGKKA